MYKYFIFIGQNIYNITQPWTIYGTLTIRVVLEIVNDLYNLHEYYYIEVH